MSGISFVSKDVMLPGEEDRPNLEKDRPDEKYDARPLWEKLAENKRKAMEDEEEKMRFSNQIKFVDDDEVAFLESLNDSERQKQKEIADETRRALEQFRQAGSLDAKASVGTKSSEVATSAPRAVVQKTVDQQKNLLSSLVQRKKKPRVDNSTNTEAQSIKEQKEKAEKKIAEQAASEKPSASPKPADKGQADSITQLLGAYGDSEDESE